MDISCASNPPLGGDARAVEKIAHLADQFGNGIIELTNRANLQLRGVSMADHPALIDALVQAELVDMDPDLDAAPQILVAPNCDADIRNLYDNLRRAKLPNLPAKFGMVLEQGGQMLMQASGDIRLCALGDQVVVWADGCDGGFVCHSQMLWAMLKNWPRGSRNIAMPIIGACHRF